MKFEFCVKQEEDNLFLRDFLRLKRVSSGLCTAVKHDKGFFCNGEGIHTNVRVHAGDQISFSLPPEKNTCVKAQDLPLSILYEDDCAMVLEKPLGQAVHPTRGYQSGTLANAFYGEMKKRGWQALFRPVNRIDRGTSGMVLCAMNAYAAPILAASCQKVYYAVVEGHLPENKGVINAPIVHCEDSIIKRQVGEGGKPSRTEYEVVGANDAYSLVRCVPVTGRTHQIRVHFAWLGHPLAGDSFYGGNTALSRPALHCADMSFSVFKEVHIRLPLPKDIRSIIEKTNVISKERWLFAKNVIVNDL